MFKRLRYIGKDYERYANHIYELIDDDFTCKVYINTDQGATSCDGIMVMIAEYQKRNLPIAPNIARLHRFAKSNQHWITYSKNWIDSNYPDIKYGSKYFPCILRQFKQLSFGKGDATPTRNH